MSLFFIVGNVVRLLREGEETSLLTWRPGEEEVDRRRKVVLINCFKTFICLLRCQYLSKQPLEMGAFLRLILHPIVASSTFRVKYNRRASQTASNLQTRAPITAGRESSRVLEYRWMDALTVLRVLYCHSYSSYCT
jgi:hypothetical protein